MTSLAALPAFLAHFAAGVALLAAAIALHMRLTPHDELALIRGGSAGAAVALAGVVVGFALPIGSTISHSAGALDAAVWDWWRCWPSRAPSCSAPASCCRTGARRWSSGGSWPGPR